MTGRTPWKLTRESGVLAWHDLACRRCPSCRMGAPGRCAQPSDMGEAEDRTLSIACPDGLTTDVVETAAVALDLILGAAAAGPAVLLLGDGRAAAHVARLLHDAGIRPLVLHGDVPVEADVPFAPDDDLRASFRETSPSGRSDVVVALNGDLGAAARAVRRGGAIASAGPVQNAPRFPAVVQRELTVQRPRDPMTAFGRLRLGAFPSRLEVAS